MILVSLDTNISIYRCLRSFHAKMTISNEEIFEIGVFAVVKPIHTLHTLLLLKNVKNSCFKKLGFVMIRLIYNENTF